MKENIIGKQYGRLTVTAEAEPRGKRKYFLCRCACGNEKIVEMSHLKDGHTKSCGCYRKELQRNKKIDLTGQRFGRLVVLGPATGETVRPRDWKCRCDCGKNVICQGEYLRSGVTRSCGCLQEEQRKENMKKAIHFVNGTCVEKIACRKTSASNTTGHRGVYRRENNRWRACIGFQGRLYSLGSFASYEDAVKARLEAEENMYDKFLEKYGNQKKEESDSQLEKMVKNL